ncbi:hypothetical protein JW935_24775, partial [candidate division KSB1 bacterium]|nr:hypothetical protein [candidate division KSB1 bacterium]
MKQVYACAVAFMLITGNADSQNLKPHQKTSSGSKFSIRTDSQIPDHFSVETDPEATKLKIDFEVPVNGIYPAQHHTPLNLSRNNNGIKNLTRIPALSSNHEHSALLQESDLAWWWAFNYSWDEFDVLLDSMANEGYRLEDIDVYGQTDL